MIQRAPSPADLALRYWEALDLPDLVRPALLPLRARAKIPAALGWPQYDWAAGRRALVAARNHGDAANVGLVLGTGTRLVSVDVDGPAGEAALAAASGGITPSTWEILTGSGRGRQLVYRLPPDWAGPAPRTLLLRDADHQELLLLGDASQVVLPPSIHPETGAEYRWAPGHAPHELALPAVAPAWVQAAFRGAQPAGLPAVAPGGPARPGSQPLPVGVSDADLETYARGLAPVPRDAGHPVLVAVAVRLARAGASPDQVGRVLARVRTARGAGRDDGLPAWLATRARAVAPRPDPRWASVLTDVLGEAPAAESCSIPGIEDLSSSSSLSYAPAFFGAADDAAPTCGCCVLAEDVTRPGAYRVLRVPCRRHECAHCRDWWRYHAYRRYAPCLEWGDGVVRIDCPDERIAGLQRVLQRIAYADGTPVRGWWIARDGGRIYYVLSRWDRIGGEELSLAEARVRLAEDLRDVPAPAKGRRGIQPFGHLWPDEGEVTAPPDVWRPVLERAAATAPDVAHELAVAGADVAPSRTWSCGPVTAWILPAVRGPRDLAERMLATGRWRRVRWPKKMRDPGLVRQAE